MIQPVKTGKNVRRRSAFTLMELMIVVAIIVVLAGLGGIAFFGQLEKAKMSSRTSSARCWRMLSQLTLRMKIKCPIIWENCKTAPLPS